ncbi:MFS transporter [Streptococcus agalactiae]|nr:MFS transporter [Streptococcus agalactiae]ANI27932.1 MFS transporter [Streptococcus agalactiae]APO42360.1 MFS transporter [Streptococcus agalactiae]AUO81054.1 MFS transporter [Streptococcus agalactiae]AUO82643.1 MFS transporter [Streptococcus agalactiae]
MKIFMEKLSLLSLSLILLSTFSTSPALPQMISYYRVKDLPSPQVELLFSIPSMAIIFILLITPWLSKKLSEKHMIIFGLLLTALGGGLPVVSQNYLLVFVSRLLLGSGIGFINARAISVISEYYQGKERRKLLGLRGSFEVLGNAGLTALAGLLLTFGWSKSFMIYFLALPILVLYLVFAPKKVVKDTNDKIKTKGQKIPKADLTYIVALAILAGFVITINTGINLRIPLLVVEFGLGTPAQASLVLSAMMLMGIIAGMSFSQLIAIFHKQLIPICLVLFSLTLLGVGLPSNLMVLTISAMASGFLYSLMVTAVFSLVADRVEYSLVGSATTLVLVFCNIGGASAAILLSCSDHLLGQINAVFYVYAILSLAVGMIYFFKRLFFKKM